jgi:hypothetical protein
VPVASLTIDTEGSTGISDSVLMFMDARAARSSRAMTTAACSR